MQVRTALQAVTRLSPVHQWMTAVPGVDAWRNSLPYNACSGLTRTMFAPPNGGHSDVVNNRVILHNTSSAVGGQQKRRNLMQHGFSCAACSSAVPWRQIVRAVRTETVIDRG